MHVYGFLPPNRSTRSVILVKSPLAWVYVSQSDVLVLRTPSNSVTTPRPNPRRAQLYTGSLDRPLTYEMHQFQNACSALSSA